MLRFDLESTALLPFERNYYLRPERHGDDGECGGVQPICWFVQREIEELDSRGMPDHVMFREEKLLFLKDQCEQDSSPGMLRRERNEIK